MVLCSHLATRFITVYIYNYFALFSAILKRGCSRKLWVYKAEDCLGTNRNRAHTGLFQTRHLLWCPLVPECKVSTSSPGYFKKGVFTLVHSEYRTCAPCPCTKWEHCLTYSFWCIGGKYGNNILYAAVKIPTTLTGGNIGYDKGLPVHDAWEEFVKTKVTRPSLYYRMVSCLLKHITRKIRSNFIVIFCLFLDNDIRKMETSNDVIYP